MYLNFRKHATSFFFKLYNTFLYFTLCDWLFTILVFHLSSHKPPHLLLLWIFFLFVPSVTLWIFKDNFTICDWFSLSHTKTQPTQSRVCVHNHHQRSSNTQKVSNFPFHWFIYLHSMLNKSKIITSFPPHLSPSSQPHQNQICIVDLAMAELRAPELIGFKRRLAVQCIVTAIFPFFLYCEILAWKR